MAISKDKAWRPLTQDADVRVLKYGWGPANANALALRLAGAGWMVVSPALDAPAGAYDELEREGGVSVLLAPNAYHYLGQAAWQRRFPQARSFAPRGALERLAKKASRLAVGSAEDLARELPGGIELVFPDGQKSPDLLVRFSSASGETAWWLGDLFSNTSPADQAWWLRGLSRLAGSGPGYRRNARPGLVYVNEPTAWLASVRRVLLQHPPTLVVPAHGDAVVADAAQRTAAILA
jgi:hypothetical protein